MIATRGLEDNSELAVGEGVVVLRRRGRPAATAQILGEQANYPERGMKTLWLDRMIHEPHEHTLGGVPVAGAVVTQLQIQVPT